MTLSRPEGEHCDTCLYHDGFTGTCHRFPPHNWPNGVPYWPSVKRDDWCGEFKKPERERLLSEAGIDRR